jgi:integrase/recombinase XerD
MFTQLFTRSHAIARHLSAPLVYERGEYLNHCLAQGMSRRNLRRKAWILLSAVEYLRLAERPNDTINHSEIETAATRWSRHSRQTIKFKQSKQHFLSEASRWLTFLNRIHTQPKPQRVCDKMLAEFRNFTRDDRGLSPVTVDYRCRTVQPFLEQLLSEVPTLESISVSDIDSLLLKKVSEQHYARISIRGYASSLRAFFRYAEFRGWCHAGIAASVMSPRVFRQETLPSGPTWEVVQQILAATAGNHPTEIRDHALLLLFAIYAVRSREAARLQFSDIDWKRDRIIFTRSKEARQHEFPLLPEVGTAIIRYLKEARPKSSYQQIFLTAVPPIGPLSQGAIWFAVSRRLRDRAPLLRHFGPHSLRHACATHLINQGLTLKEVGDHLGQRDPDATRIYAKVDLGRLREVATFDLGGLL